MQKFHTARQKFTVVEGTLVPIVSGGADDGDDADEDSDDDGDVDQPSGKMIPEKRVEQIASREKSRGERAGRKSVLHELGFDSLDEAKAALSKRSESERIESDQIAEERRRLDREKAAIDRERAEAAQERFNAKVERRLIKAKADPDRVEKISRLLDVDFADDVTEDDIDEAIEHLKADMPELFATKSSDEDTEGDSEKQVRRADSDPGRAPKKKTSGSPEDRAKSTFYERHPDLIRS